jgi:menaquinone-specific isochorismate synthase
VRTVRVDDPGSLIEWLEPLHPTAFLRGGDGIVGIGERVTFLHDSVDRIAGLGAWWRSLCASAVIEDEVGLPGTGLVAFGSFAFSEGSPEASRLIVPAVIVGRREGVAWMTTIDDGMPVSPSRVGASVATALHPGAMSTELYTSAVGAATREIAEGNARKVVLARDLVGSIPAASDRRGVIARLADAYPDTFAFAVHGLIGASPETLVRVTDGVVSARVLAGTAARGADATADAAAEAAILSSPKDRDEHAFALSSVLSALEPHASSLSASEEPFALKLPNLFHLASDVAGILSDESSALDLVGALHPTAAVAGTPTPAAIALIDELEPFDRGRYAGPVGWVGANGDGEWAIALRCAHIDEHGTVTAWAGAGIVADSVPERELAETELKFRPIRDALR